VLRVERIAVRYGPIHAVQGVSFEIGDGEVLALLGPNGAGKSSTLAGIMGVARVGQGRVELDGHDITNQPTEAIVRRGVSLTPEGRRIFAALTVEENLRLGGAIRRRAAASAREEVLDLFPILRERLAAPAGSLSGGQQQQLAIARSLMSQPRVLLLDEPSVGLAPLVVDALFTLLGELARRGTTLLLVEQHGSRALQLAQRCVVLGAGRPTYVGDSAELLESNALSAMYLGGASRS
jgi:branched-chain amino acid transport system ATP-binding protein